MPNRDVSVVLPAYNEAATLEHTVKVTLETLASFLPAGQYEVIIAEDGCTDRTPAIADRLAAEDDRVRHRHSDERLGRGRALERAFRAADGETLVYVDTDLATDMRHLEELVTTVRSGEADIATGSRRLPSREQERTLERGIASAGFNTLVRLGLRSDLYDHQCGFKAFDREALFSLLDDVEDDHWFWDTEVLVRAQRRGYRITEFPVEWEPRGDTSVDLVRDVAGMGSQLVRVWWEFTVAPRVTPRVTFAAGSVLMLGALALMTIYLDPAKVLDAIADADRGLVAVAGALYLLSWPLRGVRYRDILAELGYRESVGLLTGAVFLSQLGNLVFPARAGDAIRAYIVKTRRTVPYPSGFASLAVERVFDLLAITTLAAAVFVGLFATGRVSSVANIIATDIGPITIGGETVRPAVAARTALQVAALVGVAAITVVAVLLGSARRETTLLRPAVRRLSADAYAEQVAGVLEQFVGDIQQVAADRSPFVRVGLASLAIWSVDIVTAIVVVRAFDIPVTSYVVAVGVVAVSVGNLAKVVPLLPGGIGLYEGVFTLLVVGLTTVAAPVALAIAIVDHTVKNIVTVGGGVAAMLQLNVSLTEAVETTPTEEHTAEPDSDAVGGSKD